MMTAPNVSAVFAVGWPLTRKALMLRGIVATAAYLIWALGEKAMAAMGLAIALVGLLLGVLFGFSRR